MAMETNGLAHDVASLRTSALHDCLDRFVAAVNGNLRVKKILKDWNPLIVLETTDTGEQFHFRVAETVLSRPEPGDTSAPHRVALQATEEILRAVFSGDVNPVQAHLAGDLAVFANDRDNVKLDAICLVLWGL
jgi:hypothetical protein